MTLTPSKWDKRFLDLAKYISTWSKDPSTQVGAVAVNDRSIYFGYNGFPERIEDSEERLSDRELKYKLMVHAEINLLTKGDIKGSTVYVYPFLPCSTCAGALINAGVIRIVTYSSDILRWQDSFELSKKLFKEAGIQVTIFDEE